MRKLFLLALACLLAAGLSGCLSGTGEDLIYLDQNVSNYYGDANGSTGITDTGSYWLCTAADCSTSCQVQIKDGLITGCT